MEAAGLSLESPDLTCGQEGRRQCADSKGTTFTVLELLESVTVGENRRQLMGKARATRGEEGRSGACSVLQLAARGQTAVVFLCPSVAPRLLLMPGAHRGLL